MPSGKDVLFFSDTIFDTDLGMVTFFREFCRESEPIDQSRLDLPKIYYESYLLEDCTTNVLDFIFKSKFRDQTKELYEETMVKRYSEVINRSPFTDIAAMVMGQQIAQPNTHITPVIVCKTQFEANILHRELSDKLEILVVPDEELKDLSLQRFTRVVIRNVTDLSKLDYAQVKGKNILVLSYRFNFELNDSIKLLPEYTILYSDVNEFVCILPYSNYETPPNKPNKTIKETDDNDH